MADMDELIARATPRADFSVVGDLPKTYWEGLDQQAKQEQRDLFKAGLPKDANGQIDLSKAYERLLQVGGAAAAKEGLGGLLTQKKLDLYSAQDQDAYGGVRPVQQPQPNVTQPQPVFSQPSGAVPSTPRVVGDAEGVRSGIYDQPAAPGARPPIQTDAPVAVPAMSPNQRVSQGFTNPAAPVNPQSVPPNDYIEREANRAQVLRKYAAQAGALGDKERAKALEAHAASIDKMVSEYREAGLKERQSVIEPVVKNAADRLGKSQEKADSIADGILVSHDLMAQLDSKSGIFSGQWANEKLALAKIGKVIGLDVPADRITNTEAFSALVGKKVAQTVKAFGSGTSITNQDREYAAKMEAGDIKLDETSMRRIIAITDKINRGVIDKHNQQVNDLIKSRPELAHLADTLKVQQPPPYSPPKPQTFTGPSGRTYKVINGQLVP